MALAVAGVVTSMVVVVIHGIGMLLWTLQIVAMMVVSSPMAMVAVIALVVVVATVLIVYMCACCCGRSWGG